jgi:hypothetical protein
MHLTTNHPSSSYHQPVVMAYGAPYGVLDRIPGLEFATAGEIIRRRLSAANSAIADGKPDEQYWLDSIGGRELAERFVALARAAGALEIDE